MPKLEPKSISRSKIISRPRVKTKKWVRKKNGLFGWVMYVSDGKSSKIGLMGSNFDGEEAKKESAARDAITKDLLIYLLHCISLVLFNFYCLIVIH